MASNSSQTGLAVIAADQPPGGIPNTSVDLPVSSALLALFAGAAAWHMTCFLRSRLVHPPKFLPSLLLFALCTSRVAALALRIAWAERPLDADLALAATVLTNAGVLLLYLVNLALARRVVRALHPRLPGPGGAAKRARRDAAASRLVLASVVAVLVMVVVCSVHSAFATDPAAIRRERIVLQVAVTYVVVLALLPAAAVAVVAAAALRRNGWSDPQRRWLPAGGGSHHSNRNHDDDDDDHHHHHHHYHHNNSNNNNNNNSSSSNISSSSSSSSDEEPASVGQGSFGFAMALLASASLLLGAGAAVRAAGTYARVPRGQERWFLSRPALYGFTFAAELVVAWSYALLRFDRRYSNPAPAAGAPSSSSAASDPNEASAAAATAAAAAAAAAKEAAA
ncbi:hypothetical protein VTJ83DRAFT_7547 [Remersonia thermophila]|uniref:THH1/TOM1/TOM3 domain-containing protein n=1 Tax=Remersonia thermophila TaxID=72144 RepID=A0ABR4D659_9PEZI